MRGKRAKNSEIAYTMPKIGGVTLEIRSSANAWWMDKLKMNLLYGAFSVGATVKEACAHVEITPKQYKYFRKLHPDIDEVREMFEARTMLRVRKTVLSAIENGTYKMARKYLEMKRPEEFKKNYKPKPEVTFQVTNYGTPIKPLPKKR